MADKSSIEWTESTWNPTTGCDQTSPGCDNCYALTLAKRLKARTPEQIEAEVLHDVRKAFTYMRASAPLVQPVAGAPATVAALVAGMV